MNDVTPKSGSVNLTDQVIASEAPSVTRSAQRQLQISILRFNPQEPGSVPRMQTFPGTCNVMRVFSPSCFAA